MREENLSTVFQTLTKSCPSESARSLTFAGGRRENVKYGRIEDLFTLPSCAQWAWDETTFTLVDERGESCLFDCKSAGRCRPLISLRWLLQDDTCSLNFPVRILDFPSTFLTVRREKNVRIATQIQKFWLTVSGRRKSSKTNMLPESVSSDFPYFSSFPNDGIVPISKHYNRSRTSNKIRE